MTNSKLVSKKVLVPAVIVALAVGLTIWGLPQAIAATTNQTNPRAPGSLQMPNITGSVALGPTLLSIQKAIASQTHVSLANASIIAEKAVDANAHAMEGSIGVVHGFLVYVVHVVDPSNNIHGVIVDAGNGKVLSSTQVSMAALMRGGMGMMGPGMHQGMMTHGFGGFSHGPFGDGMTQ
ncbi:MAG: hypothetical protein M3Y53_12570 [Thermoproteota archaeon]|nr:hypothetical protein [Thermoproteota archaeon]